MRIGTEPCPGYPAPCIFSLVRSRKERCLHGPTPPKSLTPGLFLSPLALLLSAGLTVWFGLYGLAAAEAAAAVALFILQRALAARSRRELLRYVQSTLTTLDTAFRAEMPLPMAVVSISNNEIYWSNAAFNALTGQPASPFHRKLDAALPEFTARWLAEGRAEYPGDYALNGRRYRVTGRQIHSPAMTPPCFSRPSVSATQQSF